MPFRICEAANGDLDALLNLYTYLHHEERPQPDQAELAWRAILADTGHHIFLGMEGDSPVSSCALTVVPNLTRNARPYGLIENVVTHPAFRGRGWATALLKHAALAAAQANCYKVMLLTGRKDEATLRLYRDAGFNCEDKTAFIRWLSL